MARASARVTPHPSAATSSASEPVFVFESNVAGKHERGSALLAAKCYGAMDGKGSGHVSNSYAIPTANGESEPLTKDVIANYVRGFLTYAESHPALQFRVTAIANENPYLRSADVAALFKSAPKNCLLPGRWLECLGRLKTARIILLDTSALLRRPAALRCMDEYFATYAPLWKAEGIEIVSIGPAASIVANDQYARRCKYQHRIIGVNEAIHKSYVAQVREDTAVWYATRLVSVTTPDQTSQAHQLRVIWAAQRAGLEIDDVLIEE